MSPQSMIVIKLYVAHFTVQRGGRISVFRPESDNVGELIKTKTNTQTQANPLKTSLNCARFLGLVDVTSCVICKVRGSGAHVNWRCLCFQKYSTVWVLVRLKGSVCTHLGLRLRPPQTPSWSRNCWNPMFGFVYPTLPEDSCAHLSHSFGQKKHFRNQKRERKCFCMKWRIG